MTYSEYRRSFATTEEFMQAFGKLSEEEANALINAANVPTHVKACMITIWRKAKVQYGEEE